MNANINISHNLTGKNVSINNTPWELLEQLQDREIRLEFFKFKYYKFKTYDHIRILNYDFIITKMSKSNVTLISTFQNEDDECEDDEE